MLCDGIYQYLVNDANVAAALGVPRSDGTTGIFPDLAPDECLLPYLVYSQVGMHPPLSETYDGTGPLLRTRWRISAYGAGRKQTKKLLTVVISSLLSMNGELPGGNGLVQGSWHVGPMIDYTDSMTLGTIRSSHTDFEFVAQEPTA